MKLLHSIAIPDYPIQFKASNKQRETYYKCLHKDLAKFIDKLPKKFNKYPYGMKFFGKTNILKPEDDEYFLFNNDTQERVIKNGLKAGTPRLMAISGQRLFMESKSFGSVGKILETIKAWFLTHWDIEDYWDVVKQDAKVYSFRFIYRSPNPIDTDNHRIYYEKAIIDSLKIFTYSRKTNKDKLEKVANPVGFLIDDDSRYLRRITSEWEEYETRELVLMIYEL